ncbi:Nucleotidyl transferase AbiEii toxin, Type IV TA system [Granulicella rosea]|uniref:Nucleotidyl transferase AbiEii toxin, Type IV TA system n=1 Tax=Granulicella rosea TaxID=474952 RepID=A0A239JY31_9BACT|nr:nucleotidyl transferase AbiEii/AbiGii toxin family protein [Granulicella rosea]SNT10675.1 Nucleotidyl transferase AbiEii toxin, Type IV TA system [Granulicella rosea]
MASEVFEGQVALLVGVLPYVATETCFALKGGTAINLFVRDLPRLSVDIDLVYLPIEERETSLIGIRSALSRIAERIRKAIPDGVVTDSANAGGTLVLVRQRNAQIKIEVTPVLRGTVYPTELKTVRPIVEEQFGFAEIQVVSFADLYAGKLVAALDRQHPRDLFDVQHLLANEGIDDALYQAFLAYILSHNRPTHELLQPRLKDIRRTFETEFVGMTVRETSFEMLLATREQLVAEIRSHLDEKSKVFLRSFHTLTPDWNLIRSPTLRHLPAIRWKLMNLERLQIENPEKYQTILQQLEAALS